MRQEETQVPLHRGPPENFENQMQRMHLLMQKKLSSNGIDATNKVTKDELEVAQDFIEAGSRTYLEASPGLRAKKRLVQSARKKHVCTCQSNIRGEDDKESTAK